MATEQIQKVKARRIRSFARAVANDIEIRSRKHTADEVNNSISWIARVERNCFKAGATKTEMTNAAIELSGAKAERYVVGRITNISVMEPEQINKVRERSINAYVKACVNDLAVKSRKHTADEDANSLDRVVKTEGRCFEAGVTNYELSIALYEVMGNKAEKFSCGKL